MGLTMRETNKCEVPPYEWGDEIREPERVRWLLTRYLSHPPISIRAPYAEFDALLCEPNGFIWGVVLPKCAKDNFQSPYIVRCKEDVIGDDNLAVPQPLSMTK